MKYWLDKESETNNAILVNKSGIAISSCDKESYEKVESQLASKVNPFEIFGTDDLLTIPFSKIQSITCRSTDDDITVSYKAKKDIEEETLYFKSTAEVDEFIQALDSYAPSHLVKNVYQQPAIVATLSPILSLAFGFALTYVYFNKFRWLAIIIGGIWIAGSLFTLVQRAKNPPLITRWKPDGKYARKMWNGIKTGVSYAVAIFVALAFSLKFPDSYGEKSLYTHVLEDDMKIEDVEKYLSRGANIDYVDRDGDTALLMAIYNENEALAIALIEAGASLKSLSEVDGETPLHYAINYGASVAVVQSMVKHGASLDILFDDQNLVEYVRELDNPELLAIFERK
ncbi:hypothetical protein R50072_39400 [Simiduia litorea]|uniref:ankyrin repeat domain-containing protein n=1 Tax=Simiduia litorea TaxID=1435348 RepID=UPI0036F215A2